MKRILYPDCNPDEIWRDVVGYEGLYLVSNLGNVQSLKKGYELIEEHVSQRKTGNGYLQVRLAYPGEKGVLHLVHRLVAEAFIPKEEGKIYVNHKDEDKTNNKVENLEWCTAKYNSNYGTARERKRASIRRTLSMRKNCNIFETI